MASLRFPDPRALARVRHALWLASLLVALGHALGASAHGRSVSYSSWEIDATGAGVSVRLKLLELSRLGPEGLPPGTTPDGPVAGAPDLPARTFPRDLILVADGEACTPDPIAHRRPDEPGWVRYRWRVTCPENPETLAIRSRVLLDVAPSHMHFARVRFTGVSQAVRERVLTEASPEFPLRSLQSGNDDQAIGSEFVDYLRLGIDHILTGWDHLAFVFGLLLLATRLGEVARLITGFTLAHSLTLALAALDLVHPHAAAVEAVIAFSVALVAIEKGWLLSGRQRVIPLAVIAGLVGLMLASLLGGSRIPPLTLGGLVLFTTCYFALVSSSQSEWLRICLTFAFGLVHGFGFAGILLEMALPNDRLVPALLGFNLGVEIGQLGVVLLTWPLLAVARRLVSSSLTRLASELSVAALCGLGLYWLAERALIL